MKYFHEDSCKLTEEQLITIYGVAYYVNEICSTYKSPSRIVIKTSEYVNGGTVESFHYKGYQFLADITSDESDERYRRLELVGCYDGREIFSFLSDDVPYIDKMCLDKEIFDYLYDTAKEKELLTSLDLSHFLYHWDKIKYLGDD